MKRFDGNTLIYWLGLIFLFAGLWLQRGLGNALIVTGSILITVSSLSAFFVTWLSTKVKAK